MNLFHSIKHSTIVMMATLTMAGASPASEPTASSPTVIGKRLVDNFLARDHWYMGKHGLAYPEACTALGALDYARQTKDKALTEKIKQRYSSFLTGKNPKILPRHQHVDISVSGALLLRIYRNTGDKAYLKAGLAEYADKTWEKPNAEGLTPIRRWWIDDMYMLTILQAEAFRVTKTAKYADRTARLMSRYMTKLAQPDGLYFHADNVPIRWGRGNGWTAAGMAEALDVVSPEHPDYQTILTGYQRMMKSLLDFQSESGLWKQVLDKPEFWDETSGSAMFAFAMARGIRRGWLKEPVYQTSVNKAWKALVSQMDDKANIKLVCEGTNKKNSLDHYMKRDKRTGDLHGQAPMLWLAVELMLTEQDLSGDEGVVDEPGHR